MELVLKLPPPDAGPALARAQRVARLYHEVSDDPVEQTVVVVATGTQRQEVLQGVGGGEGREGEKREGREGVREGGRRQKGERERTEGREERGEREGGRSCVW